jgi:cellulose 1,4-beta-cellobiosidase
VLQREGPASLLFIVDGTSVTLSWPELSYAYSYVVYRATAAGGPFVSVAANVLVETHVDSGLDSGTYYYKVTGIEPDFGETTASPVVGPVTI